MRKTWARSKATKPCVYPGDSLRSSLSPRGQVGQAGDGAPAHGQVHGEREGRLPLPPPPERLHADAEYAAQPEEVEQPRGPHRLVRKRHAEEGRVAARDEDVDGGVVEDCESEELLLERC